MDVMYWLRSDVDNRLESLGIYSRGWAWSDARLVPWMAQWGSSLNLFEAFAVALGCSHGSAAVLGFCMFSTGLNFGKCWKSLTWSLLAASRWQRHRTHDKHMMWATPITYYDVVCLVLVCLICCWCDRPLALLVYLPCSFLACCVCVCVCVCDWLLVLCCLFVRLLAWACLLLLCYHHFDLADAWDASCVVRHWTRHCSFVFLEL